MIRLGLCCLFHQEPIKFRIVTAKRLSAFDRKEQLKILAELCLHNAQSLLTALHYCAVNGIGDFRVLSQINPLRTHPVAGYKLSDLSNYPVIRKLYLKCREFNELHRIRTTFHPDQFIVLSSPHPEVLRASVAELEYQAEIAELIGADVINIHAGGVYGDKVESLLRLRKQIDLLPDRVRKRITLENDDRSFSPSDLYPVCKDLNIPFVYDIHHHRCLPDRTKPEKATELALETWNREPLFHLSSPREGWKSSKPQFHHDYIDVNDFPYFWKDLDITVEIEAKAKETALKLLMKELIAQGVSVKVPAVTATLSADYTKEKM